MRSFSTIPVNSWPAPETAWRATGNERDVGALRLPCGRGGLGKFLAGHGGKLYSHLIGQEASGMASNGLIDWAYEGLCAFMGRIIEGAEEQAARCVWRKVNDLRRYRVASL